jgi:hypothetical protein
MSSGMFKTESMYYTKLATFVLTNIYSLNIKIVVVIDLFFTTLIIRLIQKLLQVPTILFSTWFIIVDILSLSYIWTYLQ